MTVAVHESHASPTLEWDPGSFRDRGNRVFDDGLAIYRGLDADTLENFKQLSGTATFQRLVEEGKLVGTTLLDANARRDLPEGWAGFLAHEKIPFVSYPYEWSFGMLKDAALLQLELTERAIEDGWTLKDASAFNVQWRGAKPVFIDLPSFEPYKEGDPWVGYRQFCMMFLYPLMLRAYKGIDFRSFMRSSLEGIEPELADRMLSGFTRFRKGVLGHVYLHAKMQKRYGSADIDEARALKEGSEKDVKQRHLIRHTKAMLLGTLQGLQGIVRKLKIADSNTTWGNYDTAHSYARESFETKKAFIRKHASGQHRKLAWDLGCNTGTFSKICSDHSDYVVAVDGDEKAIERLYQDLASGDRDNILPLVLDLANISPNQGWRRRERKAFDARRKPELILCLALIHHIVISANIPLREFIRWLREFESDVIIEHVGLEDDMVKMLLRHRVHQYSELSPREFENTLSDFFHIADAAPLKGGHRKLYFLTPA